MNMTCFLSRRFVLITECLSEILNKWKDAVMFLKAGICALLWPRLLFVYLLQCVSFSVLLCVCHCVLSVQTLEGCEILLGPEVTYGPPGLDLFCPVAMTIAHCAEVDAENWNIQLKRKTQDSKWEVRAAGPHLSSAVQPVRISARFWRGTWPSSIVFFFLRGFICFLVAKCRPEWKQGKLTKL